MTSHNDTQPILAAQYQIRIAKELGIPELIAEAEAEHARLKAIRDARLKAIRDAR